MRDHPEITLERPGAAASSVLVTGSSGYIGRQLIARLAGDRRRVRAIVAMDVRTVAEADRLAGVEYCTADVRDPGVEEILRRYEIGTVVHLAAIVTPGGDDSADFEYSVDVLGTRNVIEACVNSGVAKLIVTSSGAAYGYHGDNPEWISETDALRGNDTFPYARHKRLVEEMLARCREEHPDLGVLVFRPGTVLGESVSNQISAIFERPVILGVRGSSSPFVFIWDQDVVACLLEGIHGDHTGVYNLAGDGVLTLAEIAKRTGKPYWALPAGLIALALRVLHRLHLSPYGPEQIDFLRYRPVLANERLKREFGYTPELSSAEVFDLYWQSRGAG
ncbi:MAG: SDR family oxidoreductase [Candidatus Binatia bacterium]